MLRMVIGLLPGFGGISAAAASDPWAISINKISLAAELRTVETKRAYDGTLYEAKYVNTPTEGMCYAIVTMTASKLDPAATLDLSSARLYLKNGGSYLCLADSAFLSDHNYTVFGSDRLLVSASGSIAFEIPEDSLQADTDGWYLVCDGITSGASNSAASEVPQSSMEVARQDEIEAAVLARYEAAGKAALENAMIVQDVYDNASLTAVALFESEAACSVTVTVQGHTDDADITYTVGGEVTHHEVPIFGLYAGETNTVTVTAGEESHDLSITTADVPAKLTTITPSAENDVDSIADGQLYLLQDPYHVIFDRFGEVRWYLNERFYSENCSGSFDIDADNQAFWFAYHPVKGDPYASCTEIVNMTWMGKINVNASYEGYIASHDGTVLPNGNFLYFAKDTVLYEIDAENGQIIEYLILENVLNLEIGNLDAEDDNNQNDWAHLNNVEYVEGSNSLLLSFHNQHNCGPKDSPTPYISITTGVLWELGSQAVHLGAIGLHGVRNAGKLVRSLLNQQLGCFRCRNQHHGRFGEGVNLFSLALLEDVAVPLAPLLVTLGKGVQTVLSDAVYMPEGIVKSTHFCVPSLRTGLSKHLRMPGNDCSCSAIKLLAVAVFCLLPNWNWRFSVFKS